MDSMEVDSGPELLTMPAADATPDGDIEDGIPGALSVLDGALRPYIEIQAKRELGEDLYQEYLPEVGCDTEALLRYIRARWLGVFVGSSLEPQSDAIDRLAAVARNFRKSFNSPTPLEIRAAASDIQSVLLAIGKSGLAAKVARLAEIERSSRRDAVASDGPRNSVHPAEPKALLPRGDRGAAGSGGASALSQNLTPVHVSTHGTSTTSCSAAQVSVLARPPVALDGSNIAWRHGASRRFSMRGVAEALSYFTSRGHPAVVFLPESRIRQPAVSGQDVYAGEAEAEAEAYALLQQLEGTNMLVLTPEKDYDDCYLTHFAREYEAVVVSNDRFEDQVYQAESEGVSAANDWRRWISACRLPFTFHGHAFVPNPSFSFERAMKVARELRKAVAPASGSAQAP